jgi:hypothetical protein
VGVVVIGAEFGVDDHDGDRRMPSPVERQLDAVVAREVVGDRRPERVGQLDDWSSEITGSLG